MALRLAVAVSQAPGLGGTPSAGQRPTAVANASAAASSATSRPPKRLVRAASLSAAGRTAGPLIEEPARDPFDSGKGPSVNIASPPRLSMTVAELGAAR